MIFSDPNNNPLGLPNLNLESTVLRKTPKSTFPSTSGMDRRFQESGTEDIKKPSNSKKLGAINSKKSFGIDSERQFIQNQALNGLAHAPNLSAYRSFSQEEVNIPQTVPTERVRGTQKLVSGAGFRASIREQPKCEQCDILELSLHKSRETIRVLKLQISRLEDPYNPQLPPRRKSTDSLNENMQEHSNDVLKEYNIVLSKNKDLEAEIIKLKQIIVENQSSHHNSIFTLQDTSNSLQKQLLELRNKYELILAQKEELNERIHELEKFTEDTHKRRESMSSMSKEEQILLETSLFNLRQDLSTIQQKYITLENNSITQLSQRDSMVQKMTDKAITNHMETEKLKTSVTALKSQVTALTDRLSLEKEKQQELSRIVQTLQSDTATSTSTLENNKIEINKLSTEKIVLKNDNDNMSRRLNELLLRITKESENTALALERALASTIRLCVVAPTVNVQVADKKLKFKSGVPEDALRDFLMKDVLDKYTFLFSQQGESTAPDGSAIQPWIQKILNEMQKTIDHHINTAILESTNK
eukprot:gene1969-3826_t